MANLDEWETGVPRTESTFYFDSATAPEAYGDRLTRKVSGGWSWLSGMERFGFAPDSDDWCIYTEMTAEFAILALRDRPALGRLDPAVRRFEACGISDAIERPPVWAKNSLGSPALRPTWKTGLLRNYAGHGSEERDPGTPG